MAVLEKGRDFTSEKCFEDDLGVFLEAEARAGLGAGGDRKEGRFWW